MSFLEKYNKFKKKQNKKNYYKLVKCLRNKINKVPFKFALILTNTNGVPIFNSEINNSWSKYQKGLIIFNNIDEVEMINKAEKTGSSMSIKKEEIFYSVKIGSVLCINIRDIYKRIIANFANTDINPLYFALFLILLVLFALGLVFIFAL